MCDVNARGSRNTELEERLVGFGDIETGSAISESPLAFRREIHDIQNELHPGQTIELKDYVSCSSYAPWLLHIQSRGLYGAWDVGIESMLCVGLSTKVPLS